MAFILTPKVQAILDHFSVLLGIRIAFFSRDYSEYRVGQQKGLCRFCRLLRQKLDAEPTCCQQDRAMCAEAERSDKLISYRCNAGLTEAIIPVKVAGILTGFVMIGQIRAHRAMPAALKRLWQSRHDLATLEEAFKALPYVPPDRLKHVLGLLEVLVAYISSQHLIRLHGSGMLEMILSYMRENLDRPIRLTDVARLVHRSPSAVSRLFRQGLGKSFKQTLIDMKLSQAERLLQDEEGRTVRQVAFLLGFEDPLYFSRLFSKHRGRPPSALLQE